MTVGLHDQRAVLTHNRDHTCVDGSCTKTRSIRDRGTVGPLNVRSCRTCGGVYACDDVACGLCGSVVHQVSVVISEWHVVHDGDHDASSCRAACAACHCDFYRVLQGVVACPRCMRLCLIQCVFVADRACLVVGPRGVSRDSKSSFTRIHGWQQTDIPQQLGQGEAHATNRDGADAIAGTHGDATTGGFSGGFLIQTGFVDRLCVTTDPSLWRGLFWRNHPARNDICRWRRHRAWILQGEGRCIFNHAGQAHIGAACTITASQGCCSGIQLRQGILALIQRRNQCIDIRICRIDQR